MPRVFRDLQDPFSGLTENEIYRSGTKFHKDKKEQNEHELKFESRISENLHKFKPNLYVPWQLNKSLYILVYNCGEAGFELISSFASFFDLRVCTCLF